VAETPVVKRKRKKQNSRVYSIAISKRNTGTRAASLPQYRPPYEVLHILLFSPYPSANTGKEEDWKQDTDSLRGNPGRGLAFPLENVSGGALLRWLLPPTTAAKRRTGSSLPLMKEVDQGRG
jgi:hypothetical protein